MKLAWRNLVAIAAGRTRRHLLFLAMLAITSQSILVPQHIGYAAGATTYYVDCNGNDSNNGTSTTTAWRSLNKANAAPLVPGGSLLLKRGCTFLGTLRANWNGTASARILIGAYGTGALPKIQNGATDLADKYHNNVDISGSYEIIEYIETTIVNAPVDPGCLNTPVGFYVGFNFRNPSNLPNGGSYNILRYSKATRHMAGVHFSNATHHDQVLNNVLTDNNVMNILTPVSVNASDDIGAWGINLKGKFHEIAYNYLSNNRALCTYDTTPQGNAIELYQAQNNSIHHNTSVNDRVFSELGGSSAYRAADNTFAYNLVISSVRDARFIVVRGSGNGYGPTYRTRLYNNTIYYTGAESQGFVCGAGCSPDILTAYNNVFWAEQKAGYADAPFTEGNNLYWNSQGVPFVQFQNSTMNGTSKIANPQFVDVTAQNFHLKSGSPAINAGTTTGWTTDLDSIAVPQGGSADMGSYEYVSISANIVEPPNSIYLPLISGAP